MKNNPSPKVSFTLIIMFVMLASITSGFYNLPENGQIQGIVRKHETGEKLANVKLVLMNQSGRIIRSGISDSRGLFSFNNLAPETYQCTATCTGYNKKVIPNIQITSQKVTKIEIQMDFQWRAVPGTKAEIANTQIKTMESNAISDETSNQYGYAEKKISNPAIVHQLYDNMDAGMNREGYDFISENEFNPARETPLSTFSIDVDRASYANVRRFITKGSLPPVDAVRIEEMVNYFSYHYSEPEDEHPFAIHTEVMVCPWNTDHELALIGLQGKRVHAEKLPPANLVFLIDVSGSMMSEDKLPLLKKSLGLLVNELRENDHVALVVYAGSAGLVLPSTAGRNREIIMNAINNLEAGGSTAGGAGINLAYAVARENFIQEGNNRVILATDGDFNVGVSGDGELVRMIEEKRKDGIYLTVLGFGTGNYQDAKMEKLADHGNGNYAYIDNIMEARKTLVSEMGGTLLTIAKDVKLQVEFNPSQVKEYKLIGYENRLLHDRDFNDDTKDAGELGSGHTVTALYEIIPVHGVSSGSAVDPLKYQLKNNVDDNSIQKELFTVKFRYKKPDADKSNLMVHVVKNEVKNFNLASENFRFAASVAAFGMVLRNSKFKGIADYDLVINMASHSKGTDTGGYRSELIHLAETARLLSKNTAKD